MTKEEFEELLTRYKTGNCSEAEIEKINAWFERISNDKLALSGEEKEQVHKRMLHYIRHSLPSAIEVKRISSQRFLLFKIAAGLTLLALISYLLVHRAVVLPSQDLGSSPRSLDLVERKNATQYVVAIKLPDSSTVELKPNAEISYSKKWDGQKREVYLNGEAFFEVIKDSSRPFYVYGGAIVTKVLGTSFSVKASANSKSIEVSVHTGKVSVYEDPRKNRSSDHGNDASGVILTPNEKVEYFVQDKHWVTSLVEQPRSLPASNKAVDFVFSSTPVSEIVANIERAYSIDVIIESEASYDCTFTGDVSMMELYDMLDVICKSTGTNYEVKGTKILITGRGCE